MEKIIITIILISLLLSCSMDTGSGDTYSSDENCTISVSFSGDSQYYQASLNSGAARAVFDIQPLSDETYYKDSRKTASRGALLKAYTPEQFILDIDYILIYKESGTDYDTQYLVSHTSNPDGGIIPRHINLLYADDFIRNFELSGNIWNGLSMQFSPFAPGGSNDGFYVMSIIGVALDSSYDGILLPGEIDQTQLTVSDPDLHYFSFDFLQPYSTTFLSYLAIGNDIDTAGIQNPDAETGFWEIPGMSTSGNSSQIFLPGNGIDFSSYVDPEIVFYWNMDNVIEIYEGNNSGMVDDDIVTFNLSTPFPLGLIVQENQGSDTNSTPDDTTPPSEVYFPAISGPTSYNTLQWINPNDTDFNKVVVIRKIGSAPTSTSDGETVYEGYEPNYCDATGLSGTHYYYSVHTVDYAGNYSSGIVLDQVQY